ncbi:MAG: type III-B CRISPR-associated protein Cas10/Cmr2, partial [Burkholderiales bacterium]
MTAVTDDILWQAKLHARLRNPEEKALILMCAGHSHEASTSRELQNELFPQGVPDAVKLAVKRADHWASAADRAAFPCHDGDGRYPAWQQVDFSKRPVIIHPLTAEQVDLSTLTQVEPAQAEALSGDHLRGLIHGGDLHKTALAFWRFGPHIEAPEIKGLWGLLPADTRVPDHSIWDHLDLTCAFAGAFALDETDGPALLAVSLGPVQDFIAASRSTSDLWAGSHLLARLSWEAMKVVCEELGQEAILFPRLLVIPQVDVGMREECKLEKALFARCEWTQGSTDANPLFAAALPNRFTALVPASR